MKKNSKAASFHNVRIRKEVYDEAKALCKQKKMLLGGFFEIAAWKEIISEKPELAQKTKDLYL